MPLKITMWSFALFLLFFKANSETITPKNVETRSQSNKIMQNDEDFNQGGIQTQSHSPWSHSHMDHSIQGEAQMIIRKVVEKNSPSNNIQQNDGEFDRGGTMKSDQENIHSHSSSLHSHMDHSVHVFFTPDDLKAGKVIPVYFRHADPSTSPQFLPREESELIPFSTSKLPNLLKLFGFQSGSPQARAMEDTLRQCEMKPIEGETKFCATSLESMLEFVGSMLMTEFRGLNTRQEKSLGANLLQNYTIMEEPKEVLAPRMVACHNMPYPYAVFYCHYQEIENKVFQG